MEQTAEAAKVSENSRQAMLEAVRESIRAEMQASMYPLEALLSGKVGALTGEQQQALETIQTSLQRLSQAAEKTVTPNAVGVK